MFVADIRERVAYLVKVPMHVVIGIVIARVIMIVIVMVRCRCTWLKTCKCPTTGYSDSVCMYLAVIRPCAARIA